MYHIYYRIIGYILPRTRNTDIIYSVERFPLAVVPSGIRHTLECGLDVQSERVIEAPPTGEGIVRLVAGSQGSAELRGACGAVNGTYGDSLGLFRRLR